MSEAIKKPLVDSGQWTVDSALPHSTGRTFEEKIPYILRHCELAVRIKGERTAMLEMRRHFAGYVKGFEGASDMRTKLMTVEKLEEARAVLCA